MSDYLLTFSREQPIDDSDQADLRATFDDLSAKISIAENQCAFDVALPLSQSHRAETFCQRSFDLADQLQLRIFDVQLAREVSRAMQAEMVGGITKQSSLIQYGVAPTSEPPTVSYRLLIWLVGLALLIWLGSKL